MRHGLIGKGWAEPMSHYFLIRTQRPKILLFPMILSQHESCLIGYFLKETLDFRGKILMYSNVLSCSNMIEQYKKVIKYCFVIAVLTYKMWWKTLLLLKVQKWSIMHYADIVGLYSWILPLKSIVSYMSKSFPISVYWERYVTIKSQLLIYQKVVFVFYMCRG